MADQKRAACSKAKTESQEYDDDNDNKFTS